MNINSTKKTIRLILGDQLNLKHSWFNTVNNNVTYVLMEVRTETDYVPHHIQKVVAFFAAMQAFAKTLAKQKHQVIYIYLNDADNLQSFEKNLNHLILSKNFNCFEYQLPDEYRVNQVLINFTQQLNIAYDVADSEHFLSTRTELADFFKGKKTFVMESFYRYMRKKHNVLMQGNEPLTGQWNYDADNRKKLPAQHKATPPLVFNNQVSKIVNELAKTNVKTIGNIDPENFIWPINRDQSLQLLIFFVAKCLPLFGTYQDALSLQDWSLYHSRLSFSLNCKMLTPIEVMQKAIAEYEKRPEEIAYNQLEGFVRQIIGWREYMRGMYWLKMPEYASLNYFNHTNSLPTWFWTGKTKMNCLKHAIGQSLNYAYAHHIQRLMVTGNFALLAGVHPNQVDEWYLGIYIDALEWVEITNTRGMSQFADGGMVGTKPYVSSAAYIAKMSHYCDTCYYNKNKKTGDKACPFNSLYWNFYAQHENLLAKNPRIGMVYPVWRKMQPQAKADLLTQAKYYLANVNDL